jgi:broad specificity phosphatase PhoE
MKNYISLLLLLLSLSLFAQNKAATRVYIVRHAEKMTNDPKEKDPLLTEKGTERAEALSQTLKKKKIDAVYSTGYKRTKATAEPTANYRGIGIQQYDSRSLKEAIPTIIEKNNGKTILIVGHSNTILETVEAAGGVKPFATVADEDYNNLFLVTIKSNGTVKVKAMKYGAENKFEETKK